MQDDMSLKPYATDAHTMRSIQTWRKSSIRPDLFIMAPTREVGERELIAELAEASYEVQGFRDARRRHFVSRIFPHNGSEATYARFADRAFDVSEITDGFFGVDNIDLTEWVGKPLDFEKKAWQRLLAHVNNHPETDFVFLAYTTEEDEVLKIVDSISSNCGIAISVINLDYPSVESMARAFVSYNPQMFGEHEAYVANKIMAMRDKGWTLGYANMRASALSAQYEVSLIGDVYAAIDTVFDRASEIEGTLKRPFKIGFSGGQR